MALRRIKKTDLRVGFFTPADSSSGLRRLRGCLRLRNEYLDAAVLCTIGFRVVGGYRLMRATAFDRDAVGCHAARGQIIAGTSGAIE
jgi:hypothetical protein